MGIDALLTLIGSALGFGSSVRTNDTNRAIARETNAFNAEQNALSRQFQSEMVYRQAYLNSPKYMMEQYRQAGLSPYSYLSGSSPGVGLASAPANIPAQPYQMQNPFTYDDAATMTGMLNSLVDTNTKDIQNSFLAQMLSAQLEQMGLQNSQLGVSLEVQQAIKDSQIAYQKTLAEREQFETYLRKTYGEDMTDWQLQQIISAVNLMEQQGVTESSKRALNSAIEKATLSGIDQKNLELSIQKYVAQTQAQQSAALSRLYDTQREYQNILNGLGRQYGVYDKLLDLANKWQTVGNTFQRSKLLQEMIKSTKIKNKWMNKQELADFAGKIANTLNTLVSVAQGISSIVSGQSSGGFVPPVMPYGSPSSVTSTIPMIAP